MTRQQMTVFTLRRFAAMLALWGLTTGAVLAGSVDVSRFVGTYEGSAEVQTSAGQTAQRDLSVKISETDRGFVAAWSTTTYRSDGASKEKSYEIEFVPSDRSGIFAAAMTRNVFGHAVQHDPMKGEPYVWSRISGDTLTVFSLFVNEEGGYELQQFDRTLTDGGLMLEFHALRNGQKERQITSFLKRQ